jgi:hypothetical protein
LHCLGKAIHPGFEVAAQQTIDIVLDKPPPVALAEQLEVHFLFQRLAPLRKRVLDQVQVLLFGVAVAAVRQILQKHRR